MATTGWIDQLSDLPDELRKLVEADLASREFIPEIKLFTKFRVLLRRASGMWKRIGAETAFLLKGEENIRRLTLHLC